MNDLSLYILLIGCIDGFRNLSVLSGAVGVLWILYSVFIWAEFGGEYKFPKPVWTLFAITFLGALMPPAKYLFLIGVSEFGEAFLNSEIATELYERFMSNEN